jgi:NitT/TauT family transport system substrate-binding protein
LGNILLKLSYLAGFRFAGAKPSPNWTIGLLIISCVSAALTGCDGSGSSSATTAPVTEVRLGFFPNVTHAQAVLGVASGDFEKAVAPIKFTPQQFNAGPALIEALFDHRIDVGYVGPGPAINGFASSHGKGVRIISGAAANGVLIVARKDSGIVMMADLKGKKIATPQHRNTQDIAARHYLTSVLGQSDTDNVLPVNNADQFSMMMQGNIDAAWVPEPWGSLLISQAGAHLVGQEKDLWPDRIFSLTVIVTTPEFLAAHSDVLKKLLAVNRDWTNRLNTNAADCIPQLEAGLAKLSGKALPPGVVADSVSHVKFTEEPLPATLKANADWAFDLGFTKEKIDLTDLVDLSVLKKLQATP